MGLFDFFKRRPTPPTDLLKTCIQAADRQDWPTLTDLCQQQQQEIRESFPRWREVPEPIRNDPAAQNRYCQGLVAVAQLFEQAGDQSLIALLLGNEADNPIQAWQQDLAAAQSLIDNGQPGEAVELLEAALAKTAELRGSGVDHYLPRIYGMLGVAYFRAGDRAKAVESTQKAKSLCEDLGDQEGIAVYEGNLQLVQEGGTVIFCGTDGRTLTSEELRGMSGTFRYDLIGNANVPPEANWWHKKARQAGGVGDYKNALADLEKASKLAPQWPYPVYDMAFTYLLMKDFDSARKYYQKTVDLAPRGFFTAITALDVLMCEKKGDLPVGTYLAYLSLEWMDDPGKKAEMVRELAERVPAFAPAWKELADLSNEDSEKCMAIDKGLAANPDPEMKGILQINNALILDRRGDHEGAVRLLGKLALDPASTYATEHLAKVTLANVAKK